MELACNKARHGTVCHELGVRVPKACGGNWHGSYVRGVQVSTAEMMDELKVQVLGRRNSVNASEEMPGTCRELACEKCDNAGATCIEQKCEKGENAGATRIQHGTFSGVICTSDCGAFAMEMDVEKAVGVECNQCCELASLNNSYSLDNVTFEPYIELCMAVMNLQFEVMGYMVNYVKETHINVYDTIMNFDSSKFMEFCAAVVAMVMIGMRQTFELMSVEMMWSSWLATMAICYMMSHLGLLVTRNPTSRLGKRRCGAQRGQMKLQLKALVFASVAYHSQAMEGGEAQFLQRMATLAEAATSAAAAAEKALNMVAAGSATSSSSGDPTQSGLSMAARVLKNPDPFSGDDPHSFPQWKFGFCSWLSFGDQRFQKAFEEVEKLKPSEDIKPYSPDEMDLSTKLYAVLTSYLRGRCSGLVRSFAKSRDGFRLWRAVVAEYEPPSRQRSLAIAQALASYPSFSSTKTALENVLTYESQVQQFEELSGQQYPEELKSATLIRCSESRLREHLQLTVGETTSYGQLREAVLNFDKASKSWTTESVLKSLNPTPESSSSNNNNGPVPMEVDRVYNEKGKNNKGKGKSKSKGTSWWSFGSYAFQGRGRGRGKGRGNKGKGKGKSKGKTKGKSKYGGKKSGRGKGKQYDSQQCHLCGEYGHWSRECPNRMTNQVVNNANTNQQPQAQAQQPFAPSGTQQRSPPASSYPPTSSTASSIRRIYGIPASFASSSSDVRMVSNDWCSGESKNVVILDSGSDVSLLPVSCGIEVGGPVDKTKVQLRDCQGEQLQVAGVKTASLVVQDEDGSQAELETQFVVSGSVKSCILSLGQLYRGGWSVSQSTNDPMLESPDHTLKVPVFFQRNSLAIHGEVCRVEAADVPDV